VSELVGLRLTDLAPDLVRVRIVDAKGGDRVIPLSDANRGRLAEWLSVRVRITPDSPWVFPQLRSVSLRNPRMRQGAKSRGSRLSTTYVRAMTGRLGRAAGVDRRTNPHAFRHTAATAMLEADYTLAEIQAVLGHRSILSTSVYLHVRDRHLADRLRTYRPGWDVGSADPSIAQQAPVEPEYLRSLPSDVARAHAELAREGSPHRARVYLLLWLAGYESLHARILALGPPTEVDRLWQAAGQPTDAAVAGMVADRWMLEAGVRRPAESRLAD
jgi:hypothetical protein